jgi:hypothetical protein
MGDGPSRSNRHHDQAAGSAAICRKASSKTSGGWPPEIKCFSLMMIDGTERIPAR